MSEEKRNEGQPDKTDAEPSTTAASAPNSDVADARPNGDSTPADFTEQSSAAEKAAEAPDRSGSATASGHTNAAASSQASASSNKNRSKSRSSAGSQSEQQKNTPPRASAGPASPSNAASRAAPSGARAAGPSRGADGSDPHRRRGRAALVVAVIALIIALLAAAGGAWVWFNGQARVKQLSSQVNRLQQSVQSDHSHLNNAVEPKLSSLQSRVQSLSGSLQDRQQAIDQLKKQIQSVQNQSEQLAERFDGSQQRWDLRRIESLLVAANQRLQLYHDPQGAKQALTLANQEIGRMGDPQLFNVRSKIVNEIAALKALPNPDIQGLALTLAAQIRQVPKLPLASDVPTTYHANAPAASRSPDQSANAGGKSAHPDTLKARIQRDWQQFRASVTQALSHMVTVRRSNGTQQPPLMPPDQAFFLSQNLQLQLRTARLAVLDHDTKSYSDSLDSARDWLKKYYDTSDSRVSGILQQLNQIADVKLNWQAPDISPSLTAVRHLIDERQKANVGSNRSAGQSNGHGAPSAGSADSTKSGSE